MGGAMKQEKLDELVFDLGAARKGQLNENILHVFAAWIQYLLSKMYKGRRIPVRVRGNRIEVERFTDALVNEKRYMRIIDASNTDAENLGLTGTPAFFVINDNSVVKIVGAQPIDVFENIFNQINTE